MSDPIEVRFTSNANQEAPHIEKMAAVTERAVIASQRADAASAKLEQTLRREGRAYREAAGAVSEYVAASSRASGNDRFTGSPTESPRIKQLQHEANLYRQQQGALKSIADHNRDLRAKMAGPGTEEQVTALNKILTAMGRMGGIGGQIFTSLGRATAAMGAAALSAIAIGIAVSQANEALEAHKKELTDVADRHLLIARTARAAADATGKTGLAAAESEGMALRRVAARGGQTGLDQVAQLNRDGFTGAAAGVASSYEMNHKSRGIAIEAAKILQRMGEATFEQAMADMAKSGGIFATAEETAAYHAGKGKRGGMSAMEVRGGLAQIDSLALPKRLDALDDVKGETEAAKRAAIMSDDAERVARENLATIVNPMAAALVDIGRQDAERLQQLKFVVDNMGVWTTTWDRLVNGRNSARGKLHTEVETQGAANFMVPTH